MEQEQTISTAPTRWASYTEIERLYGISRTTAWRLLKAREIRASRVGRSVFVDCQSVEDYLERRVEDF